MKKIALLLLFAFVALFAEGDKHPWYLNIRGNKAFSNFQLEEQLDVPEEFGMMDTTKQDFMMRLSLENIKALYYSHGFAINWNDRTGVVPPEDVDVILVAPKGSGTSLRTMFLEGRGLNCSYAVYQDATGKAEERTIAFGIGIGAGYLFKTTFEREATSDLTGERGSLMGAIEGLLEAQYEVLREHGHSPSEAFNETVEYGLDVCQLLDHRSAWCARLGSSLPRGYQTGDGMALSLRADRQGGSDFHRRQLQG